MKKQNKDASSAGRQYSDPGYDTDRLNYFWTAWN